MDHAWEYFVEQPDGSFRIVHKTLATEDMMAPKSTTTASVSKKSKVAKGKAKALEDEDDIWNNPNAILADADSPLYRHSFDLRVSPALLVYLDVRKLT